MATWAKCPDLFLYTKRKDVYLWRCNETTSTWMPMKTADFDDLGKVMDHQDLIGGKDSILEWEESSYNDLVAYISSRRLLVNCRGLVIAELHEFDQDGKMEENGLPFYIRSLDVLSLKPFGLKNRTIPSRMVLYLETEGEAAPVEDSTTSTELDEERPFFEVFWRILSYILVLIGKITTTSSTESDEGKRRADMEKQVAELKAANKTLKSDKEALKSGKEAAERKTEKAQQERDAAKSDKEALKSDKETAERKAEKAQQERDAAKSDKETAERNAEKAQQERDAAEQERDAAKRDKEAAERKAADLQTQIDDSLAINEKKEVWMNEFSDQHDRWSTFDQLGKEIYSMGFPSKSISDIPIYDDLTTNVRSSYFYYGRLPHCSVDDPGNWGSDGFKAVRLDDLNPNKERARFTYQWYWGTYKGDMYAIKQHARCVSSPDDSCRLSEEEVKSLNILGK